ncbi:unnamed protein product [Colias eurytheme]|nr:unnamed protein product [Colias eurytheme]
MAESLAQHLDHPASQIDMYLSGKSTRFVVKSPREEGYNRYTNVNSGAGRLATCSMCECVMNDIMQRARSGRPVHDSRDVTEATISTTSTDLRYKITSTFTLRLMSINTI